MVVGPGVRRGHAPPRPRHTGRRAEILRRDLPPARCMAMDALTTFDEYVAWYLWAAALACHPAAGAAMHALSVGASRDQAAAEARAAARDEAALRQTRSDYGPNH